MKRNLIIAAVLAAFAGVAVASNNTQYNNEAGELDLHTPIAFSGQYRNDAGEQDLNSPIAKNDEYNNEAGKQDQHQPEVG